MVGLFQETGVLQTGEQEERSLTVAHISKQLITFVKVPNKINPLRESPFERWCRLSVLGSSPVACRPIDGRVEGLLYLGGRFGARGSLPAVRLHNIEGNPAEVTAQLPMTRPSVVVVCHFRFAYVSMSVSWRLYRWVVLCLCACVFMSACPDRNISRRWARERQNWRQKSQTSVAPCWTFAMPWGQTVPRC